MSLSEAWKELVRSPSEASFRPVYEATRGLVWTLCLRVLRDPGDAGDAFQSTYCRLLLAARGAEAAEDIDELVARTSVREADRLRKRRDRRRARERAALEPNAMQDRREPVEEAVVREEVREKVESLVGALPEKYRLPLELHFLHGLSQRDVARALERPLATVSDRIREGLRRLDPAFRRAGLRDSAATLGAVAVGAVLIQPPLGAFDSTSIWAAAAAGAGLPASGGGLASAAAHAAHHPAVILERES